MATEMVKSERFPLPALDEQADMVEQHGVETLLFCPNPWAIRHFFLNQDTGEVVRARCNRWDCLFCGPRKVDTWRQLVKAAEPTLFLTLTKAGHTVEEAARALTTFLQHLRRGSKGRGPNHVGARLAYLIEYFAVLERHADFAENGFHWHLLIKGVDFIPHDILKEAWRSARHGIAYIVHIEAIRKPHVIGYVTKYLTKSLSNGEKGVRHEEREQVLLDIDASGKLVEERSTYTAELVSRARRIRYSRHFFPERVAALRARLFEELEEVAQEQAGSVECVGSVAEGVAGEAGEAGSPDDGASMGAVDEQTNEQDGQGVEDGQAAQVRTGEKPVKRSPWTLIVREAFTSDYQEYRRRRRRILLEVLLSIREGQYFLSRRVINIWAYQRQLRKAG